jgi:hypothetical protein
VQAEEESNVQYQTLRELLGVAPLTAPAQYRDLCALDEAFYRADAPWAAYTELPFAGQAGLPGLYAAWLWRALYENRQCDAALQTSCAAIEQAVVSYAAHNEALSVEHIKQNRKMFDQCFFHLRTWYPSLGATGRKFTQRLAELTAALSLGPEHWSRALEVFNQACDKELDRAAKLAERMQASELGHIKIAHAQQRVTGIYNDLVALHPLPESTLDFIDHIVLPSLQYLLINESEQAPDWNFWLRVLRLIVWSVNPEKTHEDRQAFFNKGPVLLSQLENDSVCKAFSAHVYRDYVDEFSAQIITLLKGQSIETVTAPKRAATAEVEPLERLQSGAKHHFSAGDWLVFDTGDTLIRCQFLMQVPGTDTLLFVNRAGHKVLQKTVEQMSACLDAGIARELPTVPVLSAALAAVNARMESLQERVLKEASAAQEERDKLERQKQALRQAQARQQQAKKAAEAKARAEAERLAQERAKREQARQAQQAHEAREAREQQLRDTLDNLTLGTWADLPLNDGKPMRCKLAVSMRSTNKYIFVDRVGSKVAELLYDDLLDYLRRDEAVFYQPEQGFENRLESIVRGLRRTE